MCFLKCSRCQGCLYHRPGITDIICIGCVPAAARVVRLEIRPLAVVIERAGVLGVDQSRILLTHQFFHYRIRSEEHTSELQSRRDLVCRLLLEKKKKKTITNIYNT